MNLPEHLKKKRDEMAEKIISIVSPKYGLFECIVDAKDFNFLSSFKWNVQVGRGYAYAVTPVGDRKNRTYLKMHRLITEAPKGMVVDHKNKNTLDNRRCNLRVCYVHQNATNSIRKNGKKYRGVSTTRSNTFQVQIKSKNKNIYCGKFKNEIDAAKKYDEMAKILHGEFAVLNFPEVSSANSALAELNKWRES